MKKLNQYIFTFGTAHLAEVPELGNPNEIILVVNAKTHQEARTSVFNSFIKNKFATSYEYDKVEEFKKEYNMFEVKFSDLITYREIKNYTKRIQKKQDTLLNIILKNKNNRKVKKFYDSLEPVITVDYSNSKLFTQREIYNILFTREYSEQVTNYTQDQSRRHANIFACKHTVEAWQRQIQGNYRNIFNPNKWQHE